MRGGGGGEGWGAESAVAYKSIRVSAIHTQIAALINHVNANTIAIQFFKSPTVFFADTLDISFNLTRT